MKNKEPEYRNWKKQLKQLMLRISDLNRIIKDLVIYYKEILANQFIQFSAKIKFYEKSSGGSSAS